MQDAATVLSSPSALIPTKLTSRKMARLNRALLMAAGLLAGAATVATAQNATQTEGLHSLMVKAGKLYFGTAGGVNGFNDPQYMAIMSNTNDFGMITTYTSFTWNGTQSTQGKFSYTDADQIVAKAAENGQRVRCHALVWHKDLPSWGRPSFLS